MILPGHSSAGIRIKETDDTLLLSTDGNSRYCSYDPYYGTIISVAESCRNISTLGGTPLAISNCLNLTIRLQYYIQVVLLESQNVFVIGPEEFYFNI